MSRMDTTTVRPRRVSHWEATVGGATTAIVAGLLTAGLFFYTPTNDPKAGAQANLSEPDPAPEPVYLDIVPSPVMETNAKFFFGTGDGSNGYYSERPDRKLDLVRYERMP
jgi:hypothetical protein